MPLLREQSIKGKKTYGRFKMQDPPCRRKFSRIHIPSTFSDYHKAVINAINFNIIFKEIDKWVLKTNAPIKYTWAFYVIRGLTSESGPDLFQKNSHAVLYETKTSSLHLRASMNLVRIRFRDRSTTWLRAAMAVSFHGKSEEIKGVTEGDTLVKVRFSRIIHVNNGHENEKNRLCI